MAFGRGFDSSANLGIGNCFCLVLMAHTETGALCTLRRDVKMD
jgi:hypothetical protein